MRYNKRPDFDNPLNFVSATPHTINIDAPIGGVRYQSSCYNSILPEMHRIMPSCSAIIYSSITRSPLSTHKHLLTRKGLPATKYPFIIRYGKQWVDTNIEYANVTTQLRRVAQAVTKIHCAVVTALSQKISGSSLILISLYKKPIKREYTTATTPASVGEKLPLNIPSRIIAGDITASIPSLVAVKRLGNENLVGGAWVSPGYHYPTVAIRANRPELGNKPKHAAHRYVCFSCIYDHYYAAE